MSMHNDLRRMCGLGRNNVISVKNQEKRTFAVEICFVSFRLSSVAVLVSNHVYTI